MTSCALCPKVDAIFVVVVKLMIFVFISVASKLKTSVIILISRYLMFDELNLSILLYARFFKCSNKKYTNGIS
mgnify:CR=1 FL=1